MGTNIFLQKYGSKKSVNTSNGVNVTLVGKRKLLPTNDIADVISQYDLYNDERKKCNKVRLTCQVNTVCSNVLFNSITEIVKNEGSPNVSFLNYNVFKDLEGNPLTIVSDKIMYKSKEVNEWDKDKAIRDTQISNDGYVYHCGLDIFNNHLIRSKTFKAICKSYEGNNDFNTIKDTMRDIDGAQVMEKLYYPIESGMVDPKTVNLHIYEYDDIYTFQECVENRLQKSFNGWLGFVNRAKIKTYKDYDDDKELEINRPLMYHNANDFVDMYPDRSLFSFMPKYNDFRNRVEKNWNYCITYPSSSTTEGFNDIINNDTNSLRALYFNENTYADNGTRQLVIYSIAKHGLSIGDYVNIYNSSAKVIENAKVTAVASDFIFTVFSDIQIGNKWVEMNDENLVKTDDGIFIEVDDIEYKLENSKYFVNVSDSSDENHYYIVEDKYINFDNNAQDISYKKVVNGIECEYYVRIFSKLPNFKFASGDTFSEYDIYKNNGEKINEYQSKEYDFESHVSRLAFSKNVYGDDIAELIFTDDIDLSNLKDNLGRPLSSLFITIIKNNSGYKEWYGFNNKGSWDVNEISSPNVEFSHCFGMVKCGIETNDDCKYESEINSINKLTINDCGYDVDKINGDRDQYPNDDLNYEIDQTEVWFNLDKHYYGDLCYYDNYNAVEFSIQPILHRFNTAQRECLNAKAASRFTNFVYDKIAEDDYDYHSNSQQTYRVETTPYKHKANVKHEGYYYKPHHEIKIRTFGKIKTVTPDFLPITSAKYLANGSVVFTCLTNHFLSIGDKTIIYDTIDNKYYNCVTIQGVNDNYKTYTCMVYDENGELNYGNLNDRSLNEIKVLKMDNIEYPSFAKILKDGTCRIIWRDVVNNGFEENSNIEEYPFTNGAFYVNKKIELYVRRQDPYNIWGLYTEDDSSGKSYNIEDEDNYVKDTEIVC